MGFHVLLQGIFPTQRLNTCLLHLLHDRQALYYCATWEALMVIYPPQLSEIRKENSVGEKKLKYEIESFSQ